jgi:hypothetical protein
MLEYMPKALAILKRSKLVRRSSGYEAKHEGLEEGEGGWRKEHARQGK